MRQSKLTKRSNERGALSGPRKLPRAAPAAYTAYAVVADGSRHLLDAVSIVVDIGPGCVRIDLQPGAPILAGRLKLSVVGEALLMLGPGDASSINIGVASSDVAKTGRGS
jgi:hypothetical protein